MEDLSEEDAIDILVRLGLDYEIVYEYSDTVPAGDVIRQEPPAGTVLQPGDVVTLYISKGPRPCVPVVVAEDAVVSCVSFSDAQNEIARIFENVTAHDGCGEELTENVRVRRIVWVDRRGRIEYLDLEAIASGIDDFEPDEYDGTVGKTQKLFHYLLLFRPGTYMIHYELLDDDGVPTYTYETRRVQQIQIDDACRGCLGCLSRSSCAGCRDEHIPPEAGALKRMLGDWLLLGLSGMVLVSLGALSKP